MLTPVLLAVGLVVAVVLAIWQMRLVRQLRGRYGRIIDVDEYVRKRQHEIEQATEDARTTSLREQAKVEAELASARRNAEAFVTEAEGRTKQAHDRLASLGAEYQSAKIVMDRLRHEINLLEETAEDISVGLYRPHYALATSDDYKAKLDEVNGQLKDLVRQGNAANCAVEWSVGGSKKDGARMQKQYMKLMLRAFNGESDAAIAKVAWNNITKMEERLKKAFEAINALGETMHIKVTREYLDLRLAELRLEYELDRKREEEAEEQRQIREQIREEERALRELEKAKEEAEKEESRYERALEKARAEAAKATGPQIEAQAQKIRDLEEQVRIAHEKKERAISRAQMTKSGHVYVISNVGSFGENVFKIGMTRRENPMDRVRELGDASVPFCFDVHAILFDDDAPALESDLHRHFSDKRVNLVNPRKEFFNVDFEELAAFAHKRNKKLNLTKLAEAKEYRETLARRAKASTPPPVVETFPESLFGSNSQDTAAKTPAPDKAA
jgi:hypothetical protein